MKSIDSIFRVFEIYFRDLTIEAQMELCKEWETTPKEENWDTIPVAVIEREDERKESENLGGTNSTEEG